MPTYMISVTANVSLSRIIEADTPEEAAAALNEAKSDVAFIDEELGCDFLLGINEVTDAEINEIDED